MRTARQQTSARRLSVLSALIGVTLLTGTGAASACVCAPPENREAAAEQLLRYDVVFEGTVVRTLPGSVVYAVSDVYSGDAPERVLVSEPLGHTSCDRITPPRGASHVFLGTSGSGMIRAAEGGMCIGATGFRDGDTASLRELASEAHGPASPPGQTVGSHALTLAEWPLTWLTDRRVLVGIAIIAAIAYAVHYYRSRSPTRGDVAAPRTSDFRGNESPHGHTGPSLFRVH